MEHFQTLRFAVTRSLVGTTLLGIAFFMHLVLAIVRFGSVRTWRMTWWEAFQMVSGLVIPILLVDHVVATRFASALLGTDTYYKPMLAALWPNSAWPQSLLLLIVWTHGCVGMHFWLRLARWYNRYAPLLLAIAVLVPALALAGFMVGGREVAATLTTPEAKKAVFEAAGWPRGDDTIVLADISRWGVVLFGMLIAGVCALLLSRAFGESLAKTVPITYTNGPTVEGLAGATLLEISRRNNVPHASVCGGRARCSTCRVRVESSGEDLPLPDFAESVTLGAVNAPQGVRLACQIRPQSAMTVTRLVAAMGQSAAGRVAGKSSEDQGVEKTLAVMFLDVRGFTKMSENRLPYDVVFLLNRFFGALGNAIQTEGGWIDKYMGDGLLAVFGRETGTEAGCRSAIAAAAKIDLALDRLNSELQAEVGDAIQVGIGLHVGPMVLGRIGHPASAAVTVIGRTVNAGARLEALTKELKSQLVISKECALKAGLDVSALTPQTVNVRGLSEPIEVFAVERARSLQVAPKPASAPATAA
jgi:adenylate cyclase